MKLYVDSDTIGIVKDANKEVLLGIIRSDGQVRLQVADPSSFPGHVEWLARESISDVVRGFSMLVRDGSITALFPRSRLNPGPDARIEDDHVRQILGLLPATDDVRLLE